MFLVNFIDYEGNVCGKAEFKFFSDAVNAFKTISYESVLIDGNTGEVIAEKQGNLEWNIFKDQFVKRPN